VVSSHKPATLSHVCHGGLVSDHNPPDPIDHGGVPADQAIAMKHDRLRSQRFERREGRARTVAGWTIALLLGAGLFVILVVVGVQIGGQSRQSGTIVGSPPVAASGPAAATHGGPVSPALAVIALPPTTKSFAAYRICAVAAFVPLKPHLRLTPASSPALAIDRVFRTHPGLPAGAWSSTVHGLVEGPHGSGLVDARAAGDVIFQMNGGLYQLALRHVTRPERGWVVIGAAPPDCFGPPSQ
jgi:hypothetical protein